MKKLKNIFNFVIGKITFNELVFLNLINKTKQIIEVIWYYTNYSLSYDPSDMPEGW